MASSIRVKRTHRLWQDLAAAKSTGSLPPLSRLISELPRGEHISLTPETRSALSNLANRLESANRPSLAHAHEGGSDSQEPDWVYYEKQLAGVVDVKALRDQVLGLAQNDQSKKEQQEAAALNSWYSQLASKITSSERAELKEAFDYRLQEIDANDKEARAKLTRDFESQLQGLPQEIEEKLRLYAQIEDIDYKNVPSAAGVEPLPNKEELKEYHDIDFEVDDADVPRLKQWARNLDKELNIARSFPNPLHHLKRTYEWEVAHAASDEAKKQITASYNLKRKFLSQADGSQRPQDIEPRLKDALTLKFVTASRPGFKPENREALYDAVDSLDRKEYEAYLEDARNTKAYNELELFREKNPTSAVNVYMSDAEKLCEVIYDEWCLTKDFLTQQAEQWKTEAAELQGQLHNVETIGLNDIAALHPEWDEEVRMRVRGQYWDPDVSPAEVDKDRAKMEGKKHIWWEKDHH